MFKRRNTYREPQYVCVACACAIFIILSFFENILWRLISSRRFSLAPWLAPRHTPRRLGIFWWFNFDRRVNGGVSSSFNVDFNVINSSWGFDVDVNIEAPQISCCVFELPDFLVPTSASRDGFNDFSFIFIRCWQVARKWWVWTFMFAALERTYTNIILVITFVWYGRNNISHLDRTIFHAPTESLWPFVV